MGWFLRKNKKRGRGKRWSSGGPLANWQREHTVLAGKVSAFVLVVTVAGFGWVYGRAALMGYVASTERKPIEAKDVTLVDVPAAWQGEATLDRLRRRVAQTLAPSPLDRDSLGAAVRAIEADPIVRRAQIKRGASGKVRVEASFFTPVALIEGRFDRYHLIDASGRRLSLKPYYAHQLEHRRLARFPVIRGVSGEPPERAGQSWPGEDVDAALSLIETLGDRLEPSLFKQVTAVDASGRGPGGRLRLAIHTAEGEVVWGLPPGSPAEGVIDQPASVKLERLRAVAREYGGRIDAGGQRVEIAGPRVQVLEPGTRNASRR